MCCGSMSGWKIEFEWQKNSKCTGGRFATMPWELVERGRKEVHDHAGGVVHLLGSFRGRRYNTVNDGQMAPYSVHDRGRRSERIDDYKVGLDKVKSGASPPRGGILFAAEERGRPVLSRLAAQAGMAPAAASPAVGQHGIATVCVSRGA